MAAGVGGAAVKEYLDEVTSHPQTDEFARALEAGGVILWVCIGDDRAKEMKAQEALAGAGGRNVHVAEREKVLGEE